MRELFVYYRIRSADFADARAALRGLQARLRERHPALIARWLVRPDTAAADADQTWMETYATDPAAAPDGVDADLQAAIDAEAAVLAPFLLGPRHTEVFVACA